MMELLRLQGKKPSSEKCDSDGTHVILPIAARRRRSGWFRTLFVGFVLSFFVFCVVLTAQRLREEGPFLAARLGDFLIEQGIAMPKMEMDNPN